MHWKNYRYSKEADGIVIEEYEGEELHIVIPSEIESLPVRKIASEAFSTHGALVETIEVPKTVREISDGAFKMCMSLEHLILQDGVQKIGKNVLLVTAVTEIYLPASVTELVCPWELGKIAVEVDPDNQHYFSDGYGLYEKCKNGYALVAVRSEDERDCYEVVPGTVCVKRHAFEGQMYIQEVVLPKGVIQIEEEAFESCQALCRIVLPEGLLQIDADAFRCCINLEGMDLPASLQTIGEHALTDTYGWSPSMNGIQYITVKPENSSFYNDAHAFYRRGENGDTLIKYFGKNEEWKIPETVTEIGPMAFRRANLREVVIPKTVQKIPKDAFLECNRLECIQIVADQVKLYVPENPVYRKVEISGLFYQGEDGKLNYDYAAYDALLQEWSQILIRCRMAAFRLEYPIQLDPEQIVAYQALIFEHLKDLIYDICKRDCLKDLEALGRAGIITVDNVEELIIWTTDCHRGKLTSYLIEYQSEHLGTDEFDFSL